MTERIMYSEKHAEYIIYQTNKNNEQLILVMNVSTLVYTTYVQWNYRTIIKFSEFRNELSIMALGCSVIRLWQVEEVLRRDLG